MNLVLIESQLKNLELQVQILKAKLKKLQVNTPAETFGDLRGILKEQAQSTEEEIDAVLYRMPLDSEL